MTIAALLVASLSLTQLNCNVTAWDNVSCQGEEECGEEYLFTLDLQANSGELTRFQSIEMTNQLIVTPNFVGFPISNGSSILKIDRRDLTFSLNRVSGVCEVEENKEVERKI